jgi:hypothetical protein
MRLFETVGGAIRRTALTRHADGVTLEVREVGSEEP